MRSAEARVGAFVVASVAIVIAATYSIGRAQLRGAHVPFRTYLRYAGGLQSGTAVLFGGINVGAVRSVAPDASDPTRIEIDIDVRPETPVNAKSIAKLGTLSLMGGSVISITTGTKDAPRLPPGAAIPAEESISLDDAQRKLVDLADRAQTLLATVQRDVDDVTVDVRHLLTNLNDVTGTDNRRRVAGILANTNSTVARLGPRIDQITDRVLTLAGDADTTLKNADGTITAVRGPLQDDLGRLRAALEQARSLIESLHAVVRDNSDNINAAVENVRKATDNLDIMTTSIKERPWSLIRIKQPRDRKVPQ